MNSVIINFSPISLPTRVMSSVQTPINHIRGANIYPRITCKENSLNWPSLIVVIKSFKPVNDPIFMRIKLPIARKAINTNNIEATLTASLSPSTVPLEIASKTLLPILSLVTSTLELISFDVFFFVKLAKTFLKFKKKNLNCCMVGQKKGIPCYVITPLW